MIRIVIEMSTNSRDDIPGWLKNALRDGKFDVPTYIKFEQPQSFSPGFDSKP
jgi:hypothetical protein